MSVDFHSQNEKTSDGSLFQTLALVFAGLTIMFALVSIITGKRLSTLGTEHATAVEQAKSLETDSIAKIQAELENAQSTIEAAKQEAAAEKKNVEKLTQKLAVTQKELEKVKADLDAANQSIAAAKIAPPAKPSPGVNAPVPATAPAADTATPTPAPSPHKEITVPQPSVQTQSQPATTGLPVRSPIATPAETPSQPTESVPEIHPADLPPTAGEAPKTVSAPPPAADTTQNESVSAPSTQPEEKP